ncbi:hypothetical protein [Marinobacter sp.]|uniref:hypothetical protein n=1 Tax=Marinobacter sp. TaxID=50741 RepID=UPI00384E4A71
MKHRFFLFLAALLPFPAHALQVVDQPKAEPYLSEEALPPSFFDFDPDEFWREPRDSYWLDFSNWVLGQEGIQGERVQRLGAWADRTLSGSPHAMPNNESYLRIGFATESAYGNLAQFKPEVRFKLDVPTVEEKLRVVFESESEELIPLGERRRDRQLTPDERTDTEPTGAFRYISMLTESINLSNDVGARLRFPPDAFWRARARGRWQLPSGWGLTLEQRLYYFHVDGWGALSRLSLAKDLGKGWDLVSVSETEWVHEDRQFEWSQVFSVYKRLNNRSTIAPRVGVVGESKPNWRTTSPFADLTWRYRLHSDWVFGELIPAVAFPRDEDFEDRASIVFRIELLFSGDIRR